MPHLKKTTTDPSKAIRELEQLEQAINDISYKNARTNINRFVTRTMIDETGASWKPAKHQSEWLELLLNPNIRRLQIMAPRGHGKTTTIVSFVLYALGRNQNLTFKIICGDDNLAMDIMSLIADNIVYNENYQKVFPEVMRDKNKEWSKHKIHIVRSAGVGIKDATVEASGVLGGGAGGRCHYLICDDIIPPKAAVSEPSTIEKIQLIVEQDWMSLLYPAGKIILPGTPWSYNPPDIYVRYADNGIPYDQIDTSSIISDWVLWKKPAINTEGEPLWPDKWPISALNERRKGMELAFRQQYMLEGFRAKKDWFNEEWLQQCMDYSISLGGGIDSSWPKFMGVDPASSLKSEGAFSCLFVIALSPSGVRVPIEILRVRATPQELARLILDFNNRYDIVATVVENNSYQEALIDLIEIIGSFEGGSLPNIIGKFTGSQKWSPEFGLPKIAAELAQKKWLIPMGGGDHNATNHSCPVCDWLVEMRKFGKESYTTDVLMASWLVDCAVEEMSGFGDIIPTAQIRRRHVSGFWNEEDSKAVIIQSGNSERREQGSEADA